MWHAGVPAPPCAASAQISEFVGWGMYALSRSCWIACHSLHLCLIWLELPQCKSCKALLSTSAHSCTCALPEALLIQSLSYGSPSTNIFLQQGRVPLLHVMPQGCAGCSLSRLILLTQLLLAEIDQVKGAHLCSTFSFGGAAGCAIAIPAIHALSARAQTSWSCQPIPS